MMCCCLTAWTTKFNKAAAGCSTGLCLIHNSCNFQFPVCACVSLSLYIYIYIYIYIYTYTYIQIYIYIYISTCVYI